MKSEGGGPCVEFFLAWFLGQILTVFSAVMVAAINGMLKLTMRRVVRNEMHDSASTETKVLSNKVQWDLRLARTWQLCVLHGTALTLLVVPPPNPRVCSCWRPRS